MKTTTALNAVALALTLGLSATAHAGDFDFGHPDQDVLLLAQQKRQAAAGQNGQQDAAVQAAQRVAATAATLKRPGRTPVSTEESSMMVSEDGGLFWLIQMAEKARLAEAEAQVGAARR